MTETAEWQKANEEYLAAALAWLRLRLERLATDDAADDCAKDAAPPARALPLPEKKPVKRGFFLFRWLRALFGGDAQEAENNVLSTELAAAAAAASASAVEPRLLKPSPQAVTDEALAAAANLMSRAETSEVSPAMALLSQRFALSRFEQQLLLLCAARDLDTRIDRLCARAQRDATRPHPTFALALALFEEPNWEALSPERPLRYWQFLEIHQGAGQSLTASALRADDRVVNYLKGLNHLDERVARLLTPLPLPAETVELPVSQSRVVARICNEIESALARQRLPVVQLLGSDTASKRLMALAVANAFRRLTYTVNAAALSAHGGELESFLRLLQRETQLLPLTIFLEAREVEKADERAALVRRFLAGYEGLIFLDTVEPWPCAERQTLAIAVAKPTPEEQRLAWQRELGEPLTGMAEELAGQFALDLSVIKQLAARCQGDGARLWQDCRAHLRPTLDGLAQRLQARREWDELDPRDGESRRQIWEALVLPAAEKRLLELIAAQVSRRFQVYEKWQVRRRVNRGLGISVLFAGESGTGKTLAAEVLAKVLDLDLYRIDLSSVVNKYIGETEKNLRRLFDAAEDGGVVLFFDEADALFGKRTEVKDSHDRYANIEINYLLQRLESYNGLAILATNLKHALDTAFLRRLRFVINFPFPTESWRLAIWQQAFPPGVPLAEDVNFARLAKLNLTGGNIQSIAINAAFLAASRDHERVSLPVVLEAARDELRKLDKQFSEAELRG